MQVAIFGGLVLLIFMLMGQSTASAEEQEPERLPPPPPQPRAPASPGASPTGPGAPGTPAAVHPPGHTQTQPTGQGACMSPALVERIRLVIAEGFKRGLEKRRARLAAAGAKESEQQTVNITAAFFREQGIPLDKPNVANPPAFYCKGEREAADILARTVNLFMPAPTQVGPTTPGTKPAPTKTPTVTTTPSADKVTVVRQGYANSLAYAIDSAKQRANRTITAENALVPVAQHFAAFGVPHPNTLTAAHMFWANPLSTIQSKVNQAVKYSQQQIDIQIPPTA